MRNHAWLLLCLLAPACQPDGDSDDEREVIAGIRQLPNRSVCDHATAPGEMACSARIRIHPDSTTSATPQGLGPSDLIAAYKIPSNATGTIAVIDARDDPNAEADLKTYRQQFGLPPCTTANGCFKKVNQGGQASPLPVADKGWAGEIALDLDMVSVGCPNCKIILVEASSESMPDLGAAVNIAAAMGAQAISMSWGGDEDSSSNAYDTSYFTHPGVALFAAAGDDGYGVQYPAAGKTVIGVGATSLVKSSNARGWAESVWNETGSGCSMYVAKQTWQKDTGCAHRTVADMAAVGDPNTGVAVVDTYGGTGWEVYGGTSSATPLVAAIWIATGHATQAAPFAYANSTAFFDVIAGSNGPCSTSTAYLCHATPGYDGPSGLGTPNGTALAALGSGTGGGSGSGGGDTCSHTDCTVGVSLTASCDACSAEICTADPYCCTSSWDSICVSEVASVCKETTCTGGGGGTGGSGTCAHAECSTGTKLVAKCDSCVTAICSEDSYCCSNQWDSICVGEVTSICGDTCE